MTTWCWTESVKGLLLWIILLSLCFVPSNGRFVKLFKDRSDLLKTHSSCLWPPRRCQGLWSPWLVILVWVYSCTRVIMFMPTLPKTDFPLVSFCVTHFFKFYWLIFMGKSIVRETVDLWNVIKFDFYQQSVQKKNAMQCHYKINSFADKLEKPLVNDFLKGCDLFCCV